MPVHHAPEELLFDYARGALNAPASLMIETHLALDPESRSHVEDYDSIGGLLLEDLEPEPVSSDCFQHVLARLERESEQSRQEQAGTSPADDQEEGAANSLLPRPLRRYIRSDLEDLSWRRVINGLEEADLDAGEEDGKQWRLRLMWIAPNTKMPKHTHKGTEYTLVLQGAYRDENGRYGRGDMQVADAGIDHRPVAEPGDPCLCLVLTDAPLQLTGAFGRLLNPFIRY
ncbi:ChrR family anti-sigma-E factor [Fodinicurvata sediminis]|uniref:ChrR family anti-sigma-E factor n=1 Tax=Fodinicurvata sediminis TaxID=1121832 RepID=UPI0003B72821|nr:ChrR family anti-sigma-E factor [Fodinicurvata sediminis]